MSGSLVENFDIFLDSQVRSPTDSLRLKEQAQDIQGYLCHQWLLRKSFYAIGFRGTQITAGGRTRISFFKKS
jgi:hypothetical protein